MRSLEKVYTYITQGEQLLVFSHVGMPVGLGGCRFGQGNHGR